MAKYKVLSTKKLEPSLVIKAGENDIEIIEQEFISVRHNTSKEKFEEVFRLMQVGEDYEFVAFTSANAVVPFEKFIGGGIPHSTKWKIFCLSGKTKTALESTSGRLTGDIVGTADNAEALAHRIIEAGIKKIIFFCGNRRRDELPHLLGVAGVEVHEIVVYETVETPVAAIEDPAAVLFFSPSAVQSFFSVNQLKTNTICFAIGQTTADSIAGFTDNKIITSESPDQESMLASVHLYFQNINCYE